MIKSLELQGFKSFDRRISIPLSQGITAIVGPNGSGKSNIVDSICFVLGRTSAKSMRANRLTHLIYNGGKRKQAASFLEVALSLDNAERKFHTDSDEVTITRRLTRNGTMTYKLNNEKCTRTQLVDVLSLSRLHPEGYHIILQGDVTSFIDMDTVQRRGIIDEISGISEYDSKKEIALKDLARVEENIKEIVILMSERKKRIEGLAKEKEDAEKYQLHKKELSEIEANLAYSKLKKADAEYGKISSELAERENEEQSALKELKEKESAILKKEKDLSEIDRRLIKEGGQEQLNIRSEIESIKSRIQIAESKTESKRAEISGIDSIISRLQKIAEERDVDSKASVLKQNIKGIHGTVSQLFRVDAKYAPAIDSAIGGRMKFIVVENENTALECVDFLKQKQIGRATFLPLSLIRGRKLEKPKEKNVLGLAIDFIKFENKYRKIFEYILTDTCIVEDLKKVKPLLGKCRLASLDGDLAEKSGAISGGFRKQVRKESSGIDEYIQKRESLLDEIEAHKMEIDGLNKNFGEAKQKESKFGEEFREMQTARDLIEKEIEKMRAEREQLSSAHDNLVRKAGDMRIIKATAEQRLNDLKINMKRFGQKEFAEVDVQEAEKQVDDLMRQITALEPVNMKAIEEYALEAQSFKEFEEKFQKLQEERKSVLNFIDEIESRKKEVFYTVFNKVSEEFSKIFPRLSPNGEAKLIMENAEDPLSGGMIVEAKPAGKKLQSLDALSGGEKVLVALAFLFALQRYKPAPLYVLDEVDAALDQHNSLRFVDLLRENIGEGQMLIISHNPAVIKKVDRLFGVSMNADGSSKLVGMDLAEFHGPTERGVVAAE